jgi:SAM-dependent methyltransferase
MRAEARRKSRELARSYAAKGDPLGWFEPLYAEAGGDSNRIQWADEAPNPHLVAWVEREQLCGEAGRALVVGCGLGDDAEYLAQRGFRVAAFDIAPTAVAWARGRFPSSRVNYREADLLNLPKEYRGAFDLVVEVYTLQVLPVDLRPRALDALANCVAPGGTLLVVARGRDATDEPGLAPSPLTRAELAAATEFGLEEVVFEDFVDENPPVRRFRVEYRRG